MRALAPYADAVVVGSAFMRVVEQNLQAPDLADKMRDFAAGLKAALKVPE
jgi:tryptophan synthase alpha subunit